MHIPEPVPDVRAGRFPGPLVASILAVIAAAIAWCFSISATTWHAGDRGWRIVHRDWVDIGAGLFLLGLGVLTVMRGQHSSRRPVAVVLGLTIFGGGAYLLAKGVGLIGLPERP